MKRIVILTDEDSRFMVSIPDLKNYTTMDLDRIKSFLTSYGYQVEVHKFSELDPEGDFEGVPVLYESSEVAGAFYKNYIGDLVYYLEKKGALTIPRYEYLKAHHNKLFMELIRYSLTNDSYKTLKSKLYGSWVDALNYNVSFPVVIKKVSGAGSSGVCLARSKKEYDKLVRKMGNLVMGDSLMHVGSGLLEKFVKQSMKFFDQSKSGLTRYDTTPLSTSLVVQEFVPGLEGDYKVLKYGRKYYLLYRKNRENDFRASGSGRFFDVPEAEQEGLLNFARGFSAEIDSPVLGMDICFDSKNYHLIEFQMVHLGPITMQRSNFWHEYREGKWIRFDGFSDLEQVYTEAVDEYIKDQQYKVVQNVNK